MNNKCKCARGRGSGNDLSVCARVQYGVFTSFLPGDFLPASRARRKSAQRGMARRTASFRTACKNKALTAHVNYISMYFFSMNMILNAKFFHQLLILLIQIIHFIYKNISFNNGITFKYAFVIYNFNAQVSDYFQ